MDDKLVTIAKYSDYIEAEMARQLLEDNGIKAVVTGQNVANIYACIPALTDIELQVFESQEQKACEILESQPEPEPEQEPENEQEQ